MKNLKAWLMILPLLTIACSEETSEPKSLENQSYYDAHRLDREASNISNPFDIAGEAHNAVLETLNETYLDSLSVQDVAAIIDSISSPHLGLAVFPLNISSPSRLLQIDWLINEEDPIQEVFNYSSLGFTAQLNLKSFISSILLESENSFEEIYDSIVHYEDTILNCVQFTTEEKQILLVTTSIIRYSFYYKKRKDKDWETNVGNIAAAVLGGEDGLVLAVKMALAVGICQNNNVLH